jgi:hypothetical protein
MTRQSMNSLCKTAQIDHMLGGELDKVYKSMKSADINEIGIVNEDVFCSWCASRHDVAQRLASSLVRAYDDGMAHTLWLRLLGDGPAATTMLTDDFARLLAEVCADTNLKLKRKEIDIVIAEIDVEDSGSVEEDHFKEWLAMNSTMALKVKSCIRLIAMVQLLFQTLCAVDASEDDTPEGMLTKPHWDAISPQHWVEFGVKLSKGDLDKARKELDITKAKSADLVKVQRWVFDGKRPVGSKVCAQMLPGITSNLEFEAARASELRERLTVQAVEIATEDDGALNLANWTCDVSQFHAWVTSGTEVAQLVSEHAAELAWPEPEPEDFNPLLDEPVIKDLFDDLDWDDDSRISIATLKNFKMLIAFNPSESELKEFESEIRLDDHSLFDYAAFAEWINGVSPGAEKTRKYVAAGKRGSDAAERAAKMAAMMTVGTVGATARGLKAVTGGTIAGAKMLKRGTKVVGTQQLESGFLRQPKSAGPALWSLIDWRNACLIRT